MRASAAAAWAHGRDAIEVMARELDARHLLRAEPFAQLLQRRAVHV